MPTLMIVEEEKNLRLLYDLEFARDGYEVILVESGEEAVERVDAVRPDLMVIDIKLPGMDGLQTMQRILQKHPGLPVVINSAYSSFMDDFQSWLAHAYVIKSSDLSELKTRVRQCLAPGSDTAVPIAPTPPTSA